MHIMEMQEKQAPLFYQGQGVKSRDIFCERIITAISKTQTIHSHPFLVSHG
jgi:hypothetical protein